ncbi:2-dehydro-3-deoxyphosphogluconate aldolase [Clostridium sp. W14A]|uniref:Bifunctional 4-hydroxy-2-oxoglutarate aldolase/2-dehydro-3-deoxy-phosphogluconate aldolase n=1 Tax=Caproicibacter fermentans TaxID=2576756 RepID=A0A7G8TAZ4_9FIRM|nr:bifunctional 4-hydroxy-2-oxoglutarate aldolase/2-dehydro-3-deoxy-phosphogluconate aldolase [Caproicibacter fermentans]OCN00540.1 2-dehydro-3-deoxyphosphogluconate aldolase [Clostridium sp. W14A]QNK40785.1 bifunctional 4-hydroxy-2-oxoglutarate aldolase/2-dehydro-3-deoxy-phosphogluconate aldolase [Caproicibacter fermentans]
MKSSLDQFPRVTCILRGFTAQETDRILVILCRSKIRSVEIAYNTPDASRILRDSIQKYGDRILFGAGTVTCQEALEDVVDAGVDFVLSPVTFTREMLRYCREKNVISVPGAFSPSEVAAQFERGADIVKIFPAVTVGPSYFKQLSGPMGHRRLMAVGGISADNAAEFIGAGAEYLGIGSGMFRREDVAAGNTSAMRESVRAFETALKL